MASREDLLADHGHFTNQGAKGLAADNGAASRSRRRAEPQLTVTYTADIGPLSVADRHGAYRRRFSVQCSSTPKLQAAQIKATLALAAAIAAGAADRTTEQ
ncbi:hypothetical protein ACFVYE_32410 [Streptomyces sp. NPDC058239]|uniref:hypothetical protein n=1 Tax=Streptomyces sp. NPDC058239 TaxID=3346395 RepID=UPI0036E21646